MIRKPTYAELELEVVRLNMTNDNLWRCLKAASVALGNAGLYPWPGRTDAKKLAGMGDK